MTAKELRDDVGLRLRGKKRVIEEHEDTLGTLIAILGPEPVLRLLEAFGGMRIYISVYAQRDGPIANVVGFPGAKVLTERFGGASLRLPHAKPWRARLYREQGWRYGKIAHTLGVTETSVHRWLREMGMTMPPARAGVPATQGAGAFS